MRQFGVLYSILLITFFLAYTVSATPILNIVTNEAETKSNVLNVNESAHKRSVRHITGGGGGLVGGFGVVGGAAAPVYTTVPVVSTVPVITTVPVIQTISTVQTVPTYAGNYGYGGGLGGGYGGAAAGGIIGGGIGFAKFKGFGFGGGLFG